MKGLPAQLVTEKAVLHLEGLKMNALSVKAQQQRADFLVLNVEAKGLSQRKINDGVKFLPRKDDPKE